MKKQIIFSAFLLLLFSFVFAVPTQGLTKETLGKYVLKEGGGTYSVSEIRLGHMFYWEKQIEEGKWIGQNRPEPLMGDANIDGKVDAIDALFALHFAVNGNIQTYTVVYGSRTPEQVKWGLYFDEAYHQGVLGEWEKDKEHWLTYCQYNSPFFADVTKDCVVNSKDALEILKYSVGKAKDFPVGDFTTISVRFRYYPWPTEYYPGFFQDHLVDMTDEEFCEKYNFEP